MRPIHSSKRNGKNWQLNGICSPMRSPKRLVKPGKSTLHKATLVSGLLVQWGLTLLDRTLF
jgi:hypothetical protein